MKTLLQRRVGRPATIRRRLIAGLGNPGRDYRETRHNVGYQVVDLLLERHPPARSWNKFGAEVFQTQRGPGEQWLLLKPQTYMNDSGRSVAAAVRYYQLPLDELLVVCDDFNLPLGRLRFRRQGSHGGQKGLGDIIERLGSDAFPRLRLGIAAPDGDAVGHVLSRFAPEELPLINEAVQRAADGIEFWAESGIDEAMNRYNAG